MNGDIYFFFYNRYDEMVIFGDLMGGLNLYLDDE